MEKWAWGGDRTTSPFCHKSPVARMCSITAAIRKALGPGTTGNQDEGDEGGWVKAEKHAELL